MPYSRDVKGGLVYIELHIKKKNVLNHFLFARSSGWNIQIYREQEFIVVVDCPLVEGIKVTKQPLCCRNQNKKGVSCQLPVLLKQKIANR